MTSLVSDRLARRVILCLFLLKMAVTIFDLTMVSARNGYDVHHHTWRARSAGLEMGKMAYNPPLYYFPALPSVHLERFYKDGKPIVARGWYDSSPEAQKLLERIRSFNAGYLFVFYVAWIWFVFPHVLPNRRAWFLASLLLLTLPGFQKAAAMAHPDNLLMALSAAATALWLYMWRRQKQRTRDGLLLAVATGFVGLTRPFAIVVVFFLSLVNAVGQWRDALGGLRSRARPLWARVLAAAARVAMVGAIVGVLSGSWWAFRYAETGELLKAYEESYVEHFQPLKKNFDYQHYYRSFHFRELLQHPSREMSNNNEPNLSPAGNTFTTIFYSEVWGDHWLYFSGGKTNADGKVWLKRVVFVTALPLSVLFVGLLGIGVVRAGVRAIKDRAALSPGAIMAAVACAGWGLFVYWQGHSGLLPGKNSTIKFLYVAYVVPYAIATAFNFKPRERFVHVVAAWTLLVFATALPIAIWGA